MIKNIKMMRRNLNLRAEQSTCKNRYTYIICFPTLTIPDTFILRNSLISL